VATGLPALSHGVGADRGFADDAATRYLVAGPGSSADPVQWPDPALAKLRNTAAEPAAAAPSAAALTSGQVPLGGTLDGMTGYAGNKDQVLARLKRVEGQVRGIARMVEDDTYCIDVLTQVSAATKALQAVALGLLDDHLGHCVRDAVASSADDDGAAAEAKIAEASAAIARLVRS
jgi:DNA-binding FrmR family transcriptional regulator